MLINEGLLTSLSLTTFSRQTRGFTINDCRKIYNWIKIWYLKIDNRQKNTLYCVSRILQNVSGAKVCIYSQFATWRACVVYWVTMKLNRRLEEALNLWYFSTVNDICSAFTIKRKRMWIGIPILLPHRFHKVLSLREYVAWFWLLHRENFVDTSNFYNLMSR